MMLSFSDFASAQFEVDETRKAANEFRVNAALEYQRQQGRNSADAPKLPGDISREFAPVDTTKN